MPWGTSKFIELHETLQQAALLSNVELNNMVLTSIETLIKPIENDLLSLLVTPPKNQASRSELQKGKIGIFYYGCFIASSNSMNRSDHCRFRAI